MSRNKIMTILETEVIFRGFPFNFTENKEELFKSYLNQTNDWSYFKNEFSNVNFPETGKNNEIQAFWALFLLIVVGLTVLIGFNGRNIRRSILISLIAIVWLLYISIPLGITHNVYHNEKSLVEGDTVQRTRIIEKFNKEQPLLNLSYTVETYFAHPASAVLHVNFIRKS